MPVPPGPDPQADDDRLFGTAFRVATEHGADEQLAVQAARIVSADLKEKAAACAELLREALEEGAAKRMAMLSVEDQLELWLWRRPGVTPESLAGLSPEESTRRMFPYRLFLIRCASAGIRGHVEYAERFAALAAEHESTQPSPEAAGARRAPVACSALRRSPGPPADGVCAPDVRCGKPAGN